MISLRIAGDNNGCQVAGNVYKCDGNLIVNNKRTSADVRSLVRRLSEYTPASVIIFDATSLAVKTFNNYYKTFPERVQNISEIVSLAALEYSNPNAILEHVLWSAHHKRPCKFLLYRGINSAVACSVIPHRESNQLIFIGVRCSDGEGRV